MTNFEKAIVLNRIESFIKYNDYGLYMSKCIIKSYKRHCKKCPTSEFYWQKLAYYKSCYRQHKQALKDLREMQELLNGQGNLRERTRIRGT